MRELLEVWSAWFARTEAPQGHEVLWGYSLFHWARFGEILQAVATCFVVVDILGEERLNQIGNSLRGTLSPQILLRFARQSLKLSLLGLAAVVGFFFDIVVAVARMDGLGSSKRLEVGIDPPRPGPNSGSKGALEEVLEALGASPLAWANAIVSVPLSFFGAWWLHLVEGWDVELLSFLFSWLLTLTFAYMTVSPVLILLAGIPVVVLLVLADLLALKPLAWILRVPKLEKLALLGSLLLFLAGFHFELLAS